MILHEEVWVWSSKKLNGQRHICWSKRPHPKIPVSTNVSLSTPWLPQLIFMSLEVRSRRHLFIITTTAPQTMSHCCSCDIIQYFFIKPYLKAYFRHIVFFRIFCTDFVGFINFRWTSSANFSILLRNMEDFYGKNVKKRKWKKMEKENRDFLSNVFRNIFYLFLVYKIRLKNFSPTVSFFDNFLGIFFSFLRFLSVCQRSLCRVHFFLQAKILMLGKPVAAVAAMVEKGAEFEISSCKILSTWQAFCWLCFFNSSVTTTVNYRSCSHN